MPFALAGPRSRCEHRDLCCDLPSPDVSSPAVCARPEALRRLVTTGADANVDLATATRAALIAAREVLEAADPRLPRTHLDAAIAEVERTLCPLPDRYAAVDVEVARLAEALANLDATPAEVGRHLHGVARPDLLALADEQPELIGRLDGAPAWLRDHANRRLLAAELTRIRRGERRLRREFDRLLQAPGTQARRHALSQQRRSLLDRLDRLQRLDELPTVQVLVFDPARGRIAVARGDVDAADHVTTFVPGTGTTLDDVEGLVERASDLVRAARRADPAGRTAAVAWLDYDAPSWPLQPTSSRAAVDGTQDLAGFVEGLRVINAGATRTLIGHSYGSTVVGATARKHDLDVDAVVGLASPGMRASSAEELRLPEDGRVYAVSDTSGGKLNPFSGGVIHTVSDGLLTVRLGRDPLRSGFGAETFDVSDAGGHGAAGYLDPTSRSGRNLARVMTGQHDRLSR